MPYVYDFDALYDFDLSYDGWPLYDTGTPTGITRTGQRLFDLLPEYVREADTRDELLRFMASIGDAAYSTAKFIDDADPDTSASGTSEPVNPATTPAPLLGSPALGSGCSTCCPSTSATPTPATSCCGTWPRSVMPPIRWRSSSTTPTLTRPRRALRNR